MYWCANDLRDLQLRQQICIISPAAAGALALCRKRSVSACHVCGGHDFTGALLLGSEGREWLLRMPLPTPVGAG